MVFTVFNIYLCKSAVNIANSSGLNKEPCGTPFCCVLKVENCYSPFLDSVTTLCFLCVRYDLNHSYSYVSLKKSSLFYTG